jgi:hypothetical protein
MVTRPSIDPDALRARFKTARRVPQLLELRDQVATAMRQVDEPMGDDGDGADDDLRERCPELPPRLAPADPSRRPLRSRPDFT